MAERLIERIELKPQSRLGKFADWLMTPVMWFVTGTFLGWGRPQRTHFWNKRNLSPIEFDGLNRDPKMVHEEPGLPGERNLSGVRRHITIWGGWKYYVVIDSPAHTKGWYIGWVCGNEAWVSQVLIKPRRAVRMLRGPGPVLLFGIRASDGRQVPVSAVGQDKIGRDQKFGHVLLL